MVSSAGPRGGYELSATSPLSLLDVVERVEGPVSGGMCLLTGDSCDQAAPCGFHRAWIDAREDLRIAMAGIGIWGGELP